VDPVAPEHAVAMFRAIPGAQLCVVPHEGQGAMAKEAVVTFFKEPVTARPPTVAGVTSESSGGSSGIRI
jgi:hypothetical protein